jgi:hypothetical protein
MLLDRPELWGTESDGTPSPDYCKYCYTDGQFTLPALTLADMRSHIAAKMEEDNLPSDIVETAVARLPFLKRWKATPVKKNFKQSSSPLVLSPEEKHPLNEAPAPGPLFLSEEEQDIIPDEEAEENIPYEQPEPGEGP